MIQRHLVRHALELDETVYRVVLHGSIDHAANLEFHEAGALTAPWLEEVHRDAFRAKLSTIGFRPPSGAAVLDACCGFGYLGRFISEEYGANVVFCDLSQRQLAELRERLPESVRRWALAGDVTRLPYKDSSFDAVVGNSFLHHLPDVPNALSELRRVLKPRGRLILLHEPATTANFWESFPISLWKDTSPTTVFSDLWMFGRDDLRRLAVGAGFERAEIFSTGAIATIVLNWLLIVGSKLNWKHRFPLYPFYKLRTSLNRFELRLPRTLKRWSPPSLMLSAWKGND